jgi:hypothetical protein
MSLPLFPITSGPIGVPLPVARIQLESIFGAASPGQERSTAAFLNGAGHQTAEVIRIGPPMRKDPNAEVRKQAQVASDRIKSKAESSQDNGNARKNAST